MKITFSLLLILFLFCECSENKEPDQKKDTLSLSDEIINLVNKHRKSKGLIALSENSACQREASLHSKNMANGSTPYGHDGFDTRFDIIADETGANSIGENVATGQTSAEEVMDSWLNSPPHRSNIEGDFTHIGVGAESDGDGQIYFTQIFIKIN